ncbi:MAG: tetratricopeptide repeat protein, partial [Anaerolinea sp.]|nr:tetratricopeptide repeat protein [Anaerolinea sp.]
MPGNREAYDQAMNAGHNAAWDQEWALAVASYGKAIQEFPEDPEAHIHLGLGLLELGRLEDALKVYTRAHQLAPDDPIPLEKSADVLERLGRLREAAQQYINVSEVYLSQRDLDKAIGNWERATKLTPGLIPIHAKLAQAYERIGDKKKAIREYLTLAFNYRRINNTETAIKAAQRALRLDKNSPQVLNTIRALESGREILPPSDDATGTETAAKSERFDKDGKKKSVAKPGDADPLGPIGEAMSYALGMLAAAIMEGETMAVAGDALAAMEAHRQTVYTEAIAAYTRADAKYKHPAIKMNLGGLLVLTGRGEDGIKPLTEATNHPQMAAGAYHGIGQAYFTAKKQRQATRFLLQCLQLVDTQLAIDEDEQQMLNSIYRRLGSMFEKVTEESIQAINQRLVDMLQGKDWKVRLTDTRRQLEEILREQGERGVIDFLTAPEGDRLAQSIAIIDRYVRRGLFTLAMDEAHSAVEFAPTYLPLHTRMAEIMMREGRIRNAITKYNVIARTYLSRGENDRSREILTTVLDMAPLDVGVRESLIELLESE